MNAQDFRERRETVGRFQIHVVSYRLGEQWVCTVDNVSPGANIARATGDSREVAEAQAVGEARQRLASTVIH